MGQNHLWTLSMLISRNRAMLSSLAPSRSRNIIIIIIIIVGSPSWHDRTTDARLSIAEAERWRGRAY